MLIEIRDGLPLVKARLVHGNKVTELDHVMLDTGSVSTIFSVDRIADIGIRFRAEDRIEQVHGIGGGIEYVFMKSLERAIVGELVVDDLKIEVGALDYGFELDGIIGLDFLMQTGAVIDLASFELRSGA